jgi:hypothetical protein
MGVSVVELLQGVAEVVYFQEARMLPPLVMVVMVVVVMGGSPVTSRRQALYTAVAGLDV